MEEKAETNEQLLDPEWVELMIIARDIGLSLEEIRQFFLTVIKK